MPVKDVEVGLEELIRCASAAELTVASGVWVGEISARKRDIPIHVLSACQSRRRIDRDKLDG